MPDKIVVLSVDDEKSLNRSRKLLLEGSYPTPGYEVLTASTVEEAEEILQSERDRIHLILIEPTMKGALQFVYSLQEDRSRLKVVFNSGYDNVLPDDLKEFPFIPKPMPADNLDVTIRHFLFTD